ncbi:hypothetical protein HY642_06460 [Candidatus Woesearchaeota archaeon]|nr:hypothetical protein [Candidatus Woesearchaeota archaeon]
MGSTIEFNDTLKLSKERGFPGSLTLEQHVNDPASSARFLNTEHQFWNKDERLYHRAPTPVFLVEEVDGQWLYWGRAEVITQTISHGKTSGVYRIVKIYLPDFQRRITVEEAPKGKSYFADEPTSFL